MITITNTITIAVITIAIITIAIITIAIITISPGPNAQTYTHNLQKASSRFCWKIQVGDLLSARSKCLPFLPHLTLQLSTPWSWGIVRFLLGGRAKDTIQTMISTEVMISAAHHPRPATCHMPHATRHPSNAAHHMPPAWRLQGPGVCNSTSLWIEHVGAYLWGVEFFTGSIWAMESSEFVEALTNRRL